MNLCVLDTQSCLTLCDPMETSSLGSSVHAVLQARTLEILMCLNVAKSGSS